MVTIASIVLEASELGCGGGPRRGGISGSKHFGSVTDNPDAARSDAAQRLVGRGCWQARLDGVRFEAGEVDASGSP